MNDKEHEPTLGDAIACALRGLSAEIGVRSELWVRDIVDALDDLADRAALGKDGRDDGPPCEDCDAVAMYRERAEKADARAAEMEAPSAGGMAPITRTLRALWSGGVRHAFPGVVDHAEALISLATSIEASHSALLRTLARRTRERDRARRFIIRCTGDGRVKPGAFRYRVALADEPEEP
jgi:hypothetical protein